MRFGKYYWRRHWEPALDREADPDASDLDGGRKHLPPHHARRRIPLSMQRHPPVLRPSHREANHPLTPQGQGQPIPNHLRDRLEQTFGTNLSTVRLHQDEAANQALNARAFTLDHHIILRHATDQTNLPLLRHEIAHLVQAHHRGTQPGISPPEAASEREATAIEQTIEQTLTPTGESIAHPLTSGTPVPTIQRETATSGAAPADPMKQRESVRMVLMLHYQKQGGEGTFAFTPALQSDLQRLIPGMTGDALTLLWTPEPADPQDALRRLIDAGYLPLRAAAPTPESDDPTP